ncbi:MAG TPA: hypothetical protein VHJ20_19495 [Polyangia bacterium]|nr:hypothetical protein [Polyangia bacterium]
MRNARSFLLAVTTLALLLGAPTRARAADRPAAAANDASSRAALEAERTRLRADLKRVNDEVDALKRRDRGVRDDYRLRDRLADAEAIARRLTELDAKLGQPARDARPAAGTEPQASPEDGPAELEAKADILSDQARRLAARADAILARASDLRGRQSLRRHVGQMERDPFSPLEGSKRRAMATGIAATTGKGIPTTGSGATNDRGNPQDSAGNGSLGQTSNGAPSPSAPGSGASAPPPTASGAGPASAPSGQTTQTANSAGYGVSAPHTPTPVGDGSTLSVQLRELLDPTTLAEIQRLEATGGAASGPEALERAGAALKARADRLTQQAASLRARAR